MEIIDKKDTSRTEKKLSKYFRVDEKRLAWQFFAPIS